MKKIIGKTVVVASVLVSLFISSCGEKSHNDINDAKENIEQANESLKKATEDATEEAKTKATADWQKFKNESDSTITDAEHQIAILKEKVAKVNKKEKEKLNGDLNKLEQKLKEQKEKLKQKNAEFEANLKMIDGAIEAKNESFKREFKHDMDELGTALKDMFKDNVK
jgi:chromosome segregation ATPase